MRLYVGLDTDGYAKLFTMESGIPRHVKHSQWVDITHEIAEYVPGELLRAQINREGRKEGVVELDSGYQMVCSVKGLKFRELADWLAEQVRLELGTGEVITAIENFQVIREGPYHDCIAICRVSSG